METLSMKEEIDARLHLARVAIEQALELADTQKPEGELLDQLLHKALTIISRVQRSRL